MSTINRWNGLCINLLTVGLKGDDILIWELCPNRITGYKIQSDSLSHFEYKNDEKPTFLFINTNFPKICLAHLSQDYL